MLRHLEDEDERHSHPISRQGRLIALWTWALSSPGRYLPAPPSPSGTCADKCGMKQHFNRTAVGQNVSQTGWISRIWDRRDE